LWKGIKARLIVPLILIIVTSFSIFILFLNIRLRKVSLKEMENTVSEVGNRASQAIRSPLFYGDYPALTAILNPLVSEEISFFLVYDGISENMAYSRISVSPLPPDYLTRISMDDRFKKAGKRRITLSGKRYMEFVFSSFVGNIEDPIGTVVIGISESKVNQRLSPITRWIILLSMITILLVVGSVYLILRHFVQPIQVLSRSMAEFSAGNYNARAQIRTRDEIETLSQNFNQMAEKINEQIGSIETYSHDLERMVSERTQKLILALEDLKEKEIKLEQAKKIRSLGEMVTAIAHQINNPLAIISGNVQMIEQQESDDRQLRRISVIHESVNRIDQLIRDITFFTSLKDVSMESRSLSHLVKQLAAEVIPAPIKTEWAGFSKFDRLVTMNRELLDFAIRNIIENSVQSVQSRPHDKRIRFHINADEPWAVLEIEDNGGGFQEPDRVFEPFYTTNPERSGMGLTFAYHILQIHNGEIQVENQENWARVILCLPLAE